MKEIELEIVEYTKSNNSISESSGIMKLLVDSKPYIGVVFPKYLSYDPITGERFIIKTYPTQYSIPFEVQRWKLLHKAKINTFPKLATHIACNGNGIIGRGRNYLITPSYTHNIKGQQERICVDKHLLIMLNQLAKVFMDQKKQYNQALESFYSYYPEIILDSLLKKFCQFSVKTDQIFLETMKLAQNNNLLLPNDGEMQFLYSVSDNLQVDTGVYDLTKLTKSNMNQFEFQTYLNNRFSVHKELMESIYFYLLSGIV